VGLPITDGVVTIRAPRPGDTAVLVAGRDDVSRRFLGEGDPDPRPVAVIEVDGEVVGWVDHDDRSWLESHECNIGYHVFAAHRGGGYASRAVQLLLHLLAMEGRYSVATLLIDRENERSQALARRNGYPRVPDLDGHPFFKVDVPPLALSDGTVTIRRQSVDDLEMDLGAKDAEQIRWLWQPGQGDLWAAMSPAEQRDHARRGLQANHDAFGHGPKWTFAVDRADQHAVAYVDCDLANEHVPVGEANVSYSCHPAFRGRGLTTAAARLVVDFVRLHTGAREVHVIADADNAPSIAVARALVAAETERWTTARGETMVRHVMAISRLLS
jgi:RimJ/RimL family protein N-acetyltransferase